MKVEVELLVVRVDKSPYYVTAVQDMYDHVQISIPSEYFTDEDLNLYCSCYSLDCRTNRIEEIRNSGLLRDEQEAKDLCCNLSRVSIGIEKKEIEVL